jgi:hypothetical protein
VTKKRRKPKQSSRTIETVDNYLAELTKRLSTIRFKINQNISLPPYRLDIVATKSSWEFTKFGKIARFIFVTEMNKVDIHTIHDFSKRTTKYAFDNHKTFLRRGFGGCMLSIPVIVSEDLNTEVIGWIERTTAEEHWAAFEFPVIISLKKRKIFYCKITPIWGAAYHKGFRDFVDELLIF